MKCLATLLLALSLMGGAAAKESARTPNPCPQVLIPSLGVVNFCEWERSTGSEAYEKFVGLTPAGYVKVTVIPNLPKKK